MHEIERLLAAKSKEIERLNARCDDYVATINQLAAALTRIAPPSAIEGRCRNAILAAQRIVQQIGDEVREVVEQEEAQEREEHERDMVERFAK